MSVDFAAFEAFVRSRRSIRRFQGRPVSAEVVRRLLEVACQAPSAHNRQPWRFVVLERGENRRRLIEALSARFRSDLEADGVSEAEIARRLERSEERLRDAPWLVILCLTPEGMDAYPDAGRTEAERAMAAQSAALAGGHLLLAAHAEGLGACWMCAPLFAVEIVRRALDLPRDWEPQAAILLGFPAEAGREKGRRSAEEVTLWR
ncbi:MAG TPA: nitroreductase family protein [Anaerolineales bacterium]|nr:nitroreductase family protein [Anaerolineales bacterium]